MQRHLLLLGIVSLQALFAGYNPTKTEINLAAVPLDRFYQLNIDGGAAILPACPTTWTIQQCYRSFFNNDPGVQPYSSTNFTAQGVTGVRFFFGLRGGGLSTPFNSDGSLNQAWLSNLSGFLAELRSRGVVSVTPTPVIVEDWSGPLETTSPATYSSCNGQQLHFHRWLPFGLVASGNSHVPDCQGFNNGYNYANGNPLFWGWTPMWNLLVEVFSRVNSAGLDIRDFDIQNEVNLFDFPVMARLLYDNVHTTDVLSSIRYLLNQQNSAWMWRATVSVTHRRPTSNGFDCTSMWGDSAMLTNQSALFGALSGAQGRFGNPTGFIWVNTLPCGGYDGGNMASLPIDYTVPAHIDIHAYPCVNDAGGGPTCTTDSAETVALKTYDAIWNMLSGRGLTALRVVMGETTPRLSCDGVTPAKADENISGYRSAWDASDMQYGSRLYRNHAALTTFRVWHNAWSSCYVPTPYQLMPPYDSINQ